MKVIKQLVCCILVSLISNSPLKAASEALSKLCPTPSTKLVKVATHAVRTSDPMRRFISRCIPTNYTQMISRRYQSTFNGARVETTLNSLQSTPQSHQLLDKIRQIELLLLSLNKQIQQIRSLNYPEVKNLGDDSIGIDEKPRQKSKVIRSGNHFVTQKLVAANTTTTLVAAPNILPHDDFLDRESITLVTKKREEFLNRLMNCIKVLNKITKDEILSILDLYAALANRPKEGVDGVLAGRITSYKSGTYANVKRYVESRGSTIDIFLDTYARLSDSFREEAGSIIWRVADEMMKQSNFSMGSFQEKLKSGMNRKDATLYMVASANPLYPVHAHEIEMVLSVFKGVSNRPKEGVDGVLAGRITSYKSGTYANVKKYLKLANLDLKILNNIYDRMRESKKERNRMIDIMLEKFL